MSTAITNNLKAPGYGIYAFALILAAIVIYSVARYHQYPPILSYWHYMI